MAEMTIKMNAFEPLAMDEMMAVDGGARNGTRAERRAAAAISRQYAPTATQVAKAATIGAGVCMMASGGFAMAGAVYATEKLVAGTAIMLGAATAGAGLGM